MLRSKTFQKLIPFVAWLALFLAVPLAFSQEKKKDKGDATAVAGEAVLWREPTDITSRDLFLGSGGEEHKPDLSHVTFEKEGSTGYSVKWDVRDGAGHKWVAKMGNEARPETAANRLVWAAGYATETVYLAPCAHISGAPKPRKEVKRCEGDGFADVRFEARGEGVKRGDNWDWKSNPFAGKRELNGLLVIMALLNNWDLKTTNNVVLAVANPDGTTELRYVISDLGATFGKTGGPISHSRNEPEKYVKTKFVEGEDHGRLKFGYNGKQSDLFNQVSIADAKWIGTLLAQLSDKQLEDAFRAADFTPEETQILVTEVKDRINELVNLPG